MPTLVRNEIIVASNPRGVCYEGQLTTSITPKPGTCMSVRSDGKYEAFSETADGDQALVLVLLPDALRGKTSRDAYVAEDHIFMYAPASGEELLMILKDVSGTGDTHAVGEKLIIDTGTGKLVVTTGLPEMESFVLMEVPLVNPPVGDILALVRYTGH